MHWTRAMQWIRDSTRLLAKKLVRLVRHASAAVCHFAVFGRQIILFRMNFPVVAPLFVGMRYAILVLQLSVVKNLTFTDSEEDLLIVMCPKLECKTNAK